MILFAVVLLGILAGVELDLFVPSLVEIQEYFNLSTFEVELVLSLNFLAFCVSSLFVGTLADKYGRKVIIFGGILIFILGSIICIFAEVFSGLLLGRLLQGIGIAASSVGYIIIADRYPLKKQQTMLSYLNAVVAISMSGAPVLGSIIASNYGWRANFEFILILGIITFIVSMLFLRDDVEKSKRPLRILRDYIPLLKSNKVLIYMFALGCMITPYYSYVAITPIMFIEDMGVTLAQFGYYQGANAAAFGIFSIFSERIMNRYGEERSLFISLFFMVAAIIAIFACGVFKINDPLLITIFSIIEGLSAVIPCSLIYPRALDAEPQAKARLSSLQLSIRLIMTAATIQLASLFYNGTVFSISLLMLIHILFAVMFIRILVKKRWLAF